MSADELLLNNDLLFDNIVQLLSDGLSVTLRAKGNSMYPFIRGGRDSVVLSRSVRARVGDIVLVRIPSSGYVLHRIRRIDGDRLLLMGDGNLRATERCRQDEVLAVAVKIIRNGRCVDCFSMRERSLAAAWRVLLPVRRYLLFVCRRLPGNKV